MSSGASRAQDLGSLALLVALLALAGCTDDRVRPRASTLRSPDELPGCDRDSLRHFAEALGARQLKVGRHRGHVPVGEVLRTTLESCAEGTPLESCEARFSPRANERVYVWALTERRERVVPVDQGELSDELGALSAHPDIELGRRVRTRVVADPRVCVRVFGTRHVRLEEVSATGVPLLERVEAQLASPEVVFTELEASRFTMRCPAHDELVELPRVAADGPCAVVVAAHAERR